jgi:predicted enzyme related to lactoylglutathione lyase
VKVTKTYIMVMAADVARGANFYRKAFGLATKYESPSWTELAADGATIALHKGAGTGTRDTGLGFYVDDLEAACSAVKAAGGSIANEPEDRRGEGIRLAVAVDSEGNRFSLAQPVAQP